MDLLVDCESISCSNRVEFCCEMIVPAHLEVVCTPPEVTFDPNCISCVEGSCLQSATITDPCNNERQIPCMTELKTLSAVGAIPFIAAVEVKNACNTITYLCCQETVCVNQVLCTKCPEDTGTCFINGCEITVEVEKIVKDSEICVDEQIITIKGAFILPPCV